MVLLLALLAVSLFPDLYHGLISTNTKPTVNTTSGQLIGVADHEGLPTQIFLHRR
jgi:multisubunit Na+/H+ antiporter MnhG subunit